MVFTDETKVTPMWAAIMAGMGLLMFPMGILFGWEPSRAAASSSWIIVMAAIIMPFRWRIAERGVVVLLRFASWDRIDSCDWDDLSATSVCSFRVSGRPWRSISMPTGRKEAVDAFIRQRLAAG
jgi:hypothetical protein